jgi:hypothetical protein
VTGAQGGFFFNAYHNMISQELSTNWNPGSVYTVSFAAQGGGQAMPVGTQLKVWLYYVDGGNKVPVKEYLISNTFNNPSGDPITALVDYSFSTDPVPAEAAGKAIGVAISSTASSYGGLDFGYWDIDNVQLAELPEPASLGILAVGAMGLCMRRRRA